MDVSQLQDADGLEQRAARGGPQRVENSDVSPRPSQDFLSFVEIF